jgi:hypothetical protein
MSKRQVLSTSKKAPDKADKARKSTPAAMAQAAPKSQAAAAGGLADTAKGNPAAMAQAATLSPAQCQRLREIADELKAQALRLKADDPLNDPNERPTRYRMRREFVAGGDLLVKAVEAGAFANDSLMGDIISRDRSREERMEKQGFRVTLANSWLMTFHAFYQHWLPQQRPKMAKELTGALPAYGYAYYAKVKGFMAELIEEALAAQADKPDLDATAAAPQSDKPGKMNKQACALAVKTQHPDWTDAQIAKAAGCHVKSLYRWKLFTAAKDLLKGGRADLPLGRKPKDEPMEAWEDQDKDDEDKDDGGF